MSHSDIDVLRDQVKRATEKGSADLEKLVNSYRRAAEAAACKPRSVDPGTNPAQFDIEGCRSAIDAAHKAAWLSQAADALVAGKNPPAQTVASLDEVLAEFVRHFGPRAGICLAEHATEYGNADAEELARHEARLASVTGQHQTHHTEIVSTRNRASQLRDRAHWLGMFDRLQKAWKAVAAPVFSDIPGLAVAVAEATALEGRGPRPPDTSPIERDLAVVRDQLAQLNRSAPGIEGPAITAMKARAVALQDQLAAATEAQARDVLFQATSAVERAAADINAARTLYELVGKRPHSFPAGFARQLQDATLAALKASNSGAWFDILHRSVRGNRTGDQPIGRG